MSQLGRLLETAGNPLSGRPPELQIQMVACLRNHNNFLLVIQ